MMGRADPQHEDGGPGWVLAIEASNPSAGYVAFGGQGSAEPGKASVAGAVMEPDGSLGAIAEVAFDAGTRREDGLLPSIERVRSMLGVSAGRLARVCVSMGPGGYTSLRVSVTVAKTIALATGAELVGVPSASVAVGDLELDEPYLVCLASKGEVTHGTRFSDPRAVVGEPIGLLTADDDTEIRDKIVIGDRHLPEPFRFSCLQDNGRVVEPRFSARRCLLVGEKLDHVGLSAFVPDYVREPEAVRLWRARHDGAK